MKPSLFPTAVLPLLLLFLLFTLALFRPEPTAVLPDLSPYPWLYLRDGRPLADDETPVSLIAVGDVLLGRGVADQPDPLGVVAPWLRGADLVLGNLEGAIDVSRSPYSVVRKPYSVNRIPYSVDQNGSRITEYGSRNTDHGSPITLLMPPTAVSQLRAAGFDIMGLANNHSLDGGVGGLAETAVALQRAALTPIGLQDDGPITAHIRLVNNTHLAFLAFNAIPTASCSPAPHLPCPISWDAASGPAAIRVAQAAADAVIVSVHWGYEYQTRPDPAQERIAQAMLDAGADLIIGHHPHVVQPIVLDEGRVVAYSVGNFVFDQEGTETGQGVAIRAFFDAEGLRAAQVLPLRTGPQPRLMSPETAVSLFARILPPPPRIGFACDPLACEKVDAPPTDQSPRFYAGQIDLTGDGLPETVRREGERVVVYEGETAVWRTPDDWRVVDVALGDPNDDGRYEIMLALWRFDEAGYERSQPYIVGHRGGEYVLLWGGRPVVDPILELALADVDGDGVEELIVITESADGSGRRVGVWQWQGWTFSLQWQSDPGAYRDLLLEVGEGERPLISVVERD
jgi:hypothetical protein